MTLEWAGQLGHPSSYGLIGAREASQTVLPDPSGGRYVESLAGELDQVYFGLPAAYAEAVIAVLQRPLELTVAAHGEVGSSPAVFARLTAAVEHFTVAGIPAPDDEIWRVWDEVAPHVF